MAQPDHSTDVHIKTHHNMVAELVGSVTRQEPSTTKETGVITTVAGTRDARTS